jgi:histidyl-tRNA synthetase
LRPEATAGAVRAYIENKLYAGRSLTKLFTVGPMFRYERPQKGRQRQFHQVNAEAFGSASPLLDAEMVLMLWTYLSELGLTDLTLQINSLGCRECQLEYARRLQEYLEATDESDFCGDCRERRERNPLRLLDCKQTQCQDLMREAPSMLDCLCADCREHFTTVQDSLHRMGIAYEVNSRLVRGLDYYQRTTFEVMSGAIGAQSSVAGGGRYDDLVRQLGGPDHPAIGFACGMERLGLLLEDPAGQGTDFYVAVLDPDGLSEGMRICEDLRRTGLKGEMSLEAGSVKSQTRHADRIGARYCIFLGGEELQSGLLSVRDMASGEQWRREAGALPELMRQ